MKQIRKVVSNRMKVLFTDKFTSIDECIDVWNSVRHLEGTTIHDYLIEEIFTRDNENGTYSIMVSYSDSGNEGSYVAPFPQFLEYVSILIYCCHRDPATDNLFELNLMRAQ